MYLSNIPSISMKFIRWWIPHCNATLIFSILCFSTLFPPLTSSGTYCPPQSGRWPLCPLSSPLGWPVTDGHGCCGRVAGHAGWSVRRCVPLPGTHARWCCGLRRLPPWCSGSTGTLSRCGSVLDWTPNSPTVGTTVWAGYLWPWGPAMLALALGRKEKWENCLI